MTNKITPWRRVLPEKLTGPQLLEKFLALYGIQKFITAFKGAHHLFLFRAKSIKSMLPNLF
jgi:hypothetical protein